MTKPRAVVSETALAEAEVFIGPVPRDSEGRVVLGGLLVEVLPDSMMPFVAPEGEESVRCGARNPKGKYQCKHCGERVALSNTNDMVQMAHLDVICADCGAKELGLK